MKLPQNQRNKQGNKDHPTPTTNKKSKTKKTHLEPENITCRLGQRKLSLLKMILRGSVTLLNSPCSMILSRIVFLALRN